ncbi:dynein-1-beta heavy chain, flagellar inner arm I1 complex [Drosophila subpulchrella]|uniref:dynein-1-beta heavy chain, flagellar inner arm I1 complex n=1 Tax=Drosophila subpulchrella TaxID=1486046 RepID=UPI0018A12BFD|nr:dynein-1-beta heavy chain, flagellar inner arm I1 complex [Drosophila subpulchrella]
MASSSAVEDEHLTDSDLTDDEERSVEPRQEELRPETPKPSYTDEELHHLVGYIQRMSVLSCLDHRDWHEGTLDIIRRWLLEVHEPLLTIYYDRDALSACLGMPNTCVSDLSYFRREPNEIFSVEGFHDEINFGTLTSDVDGCLMELLDRLYAPFFRNYLEWNVTVRHRFCSSMDRFLAFLTGMHHQISGVAVLYVPYVIKELTAGSVDRQMVRSLEGIALYWTTQIRTLLGDDTLTVPHDLATVRDEFEFWEYRYEVLQGINDQLAQSDVQKVLLLLHNAHSVHTPQMEGLIERAKEELLKSLSNIKFLRLLIEPCSKIDEATGPADLTKLLPRIIHLIRFIWLNSDYYNTTRLIVGLFRNLSNQIIRFCTEQTKVEEILSGKPRFGIQICNIAIDCCLTYKGIYDKISRELAQKQSQLPWELDEGLIFNHIDAFVERLNDVIDICESMIVFGRMDESGSIPKPAFGGTSGEELEKISENVEQQFLGALNQLQDSSQAYILNVHRSDWYKDVGHFRRGMQKLEETVQRLIFNVFQQVSNVEETLEALQALLFYSYRQRGTLRKTYLKETSRLWRMFSKEMDSTSRKLLEERRQESWLSKHMSIALSYRINLERLTWLRDRLKNAEWLPPVKESSQALSKFDSLRHEFQKEIRQAYEDWVAKCCGFSGDLSQRLDRYLIVRSKKFKGLLECNIDASVLELCEQAQHFERMGFAIPNTLKKLYERYDVIRALYNGIIQLALSHNRILTDLSGRERKLFRPLIQACDRQLAPGVFKITYGSEFNEEFFEDGKEFIGEFQELVHIFKRANRGVARSCEKICGTFLLHFAFSGSVDISVFQQQLSSRLTSSGDILRSYYGNIVELLSAFSRQFQSVDDEMSTEWIAYVNDMDDMLASSLMTSARGSLTKLYEALHCEEDMAFAPIIVVESDVKDGRIVFTPDMDAIGGMINGIVDSIRSMLDQFPRLGYKLKLPKKQLRQGFACVFREDQECSELMRSIQAEIVIQQEAMAKYEAVWNQKRVLWETTEEGFRQRLMSSSRTAGVFEGGIEHYSALADDVIFEDAITNVYFVLINQNALKSTILDWIEKWQALNIKMLLDHASNLMRATYRYMRRNERNVMKVPRTIRETVAAKQLFEQLLKEVPVKQSAFTPMLELFVLLHKYQVQLTEKTHQQVMGLESSWLHYLQVLEEADEMLDNEGTDTKLELAKHGEKFKLILKEFLEDFYSKLSKR